VIRWSGVFHIVVTPFRPNRAPGVEASRSTPPRGRELTEVVTAVVPA
jgi:hypothetical protein